MKGGKLPLGYTIIEVLIVLAVSGLMFVIAAGFINGKQARTTFTQGVNEMASQIQSLMQDVIDGHYTDIKIKCTANVSPPGLPIFSNVGVVSQGTNQTCSFIGKFIHTPISNKTDVYEVFSLASSRTDTSYVTVKPIYSPIDLTTQHTVPNHLDIKSITINGAISAYGFGFVQSQGTANSNGGDGYNSGSQQLQLVYGQNLISGNYDESTAATKLTSNPIPPTPTSSLTLLSGNTDSVSVCMTDGTRTANINLGGISSNNNKMTVEVQVTAC